MNWIPVEQQLPEVGEYVLVYNTEGATLVGRLMSNGWIAMFADGETFMGELTATHWMLLPTPPKQIVKKRIVISILLIVFGGFYLFLISLMNILMNKNKK